MTKSKLRLLILSLSSIFVVLLGLFILWRQSTSPLSKTAPENSMTVDVGIVYLPITTSISTYYALGVDSGALVTEVVAGSPADRAGIQTGDVILSFNGTRVDDKAPLYGMIKSCPTGNKIALEVWRERSNRIVEIVHGPK